VAPKPVGWVRRVIIKSGTYGLSSLVLGIKGGRKVTVHALYYHRLAISAAFPTKTQLRGNRRKLVKITASNHV